MHIFDENNHIFGDVPSIRKFTNQLKACDKTIDGGVKCVVVPESEAKILDRWLEKYENLLEKFHEQESNIKNIEAENEKLNEKIKQLNKRPNIQRENTYKNIIATIMYAHSDQEVVTLVNELKRVKMGDFINSTERDDKNQFFEIVNKTLQSYLK